MAEHAIPPFTVAVSGHRALEPDDYPRLRTQLSLQLGTIARALRGRQIDCLSPLAAGADQLFAEEVLALRGKMGCRQVRLVVPLPMAEPAYIESQEPPGSTAFRDSYAALRARAQEVFEVPADGGPDTGSAPYVRLADYLVAHAGLLVALWDGDTHAARQPGGTLDVVLRYLAMPDRVVLHLAARRAGSKGGSSSAAPALLTLDRDGRLMRDEDPGALVRRLGGHR